MTARISNVDEACTFILNWFGLKGSHEGSQIQLPFEVPQAMKVVNRRLGRLWLNEPTEIFRGQDELISPLLYELGPDDIVPIIWENQGVWGCGFQPETGSQLWVTGDWPDDRCGMRAWRSTVDAVDTAIIFVMLGNAVWATDNCEMDEDDNKPPHADCLLWAFAPFAGFHGFWTDRDMTLLRMQGTGWGVTARR